MVNEGLRSRNKYPSNTSIKNVLTLYINKFYNLYNPNKNIDRVKYKSGEVLMFDQIGKYNKYRTYVLDVTRVNDAKYIKEMLKERPEDNSQIETSFFYPLYIAFKTIREAAQ